MLDGMVNLRILSLNHCELKSVPHFNLLDTHMLDILDLSNGGALALGSCAMKVDELVLSGTIIRYIEDIGVECWTSVHRIMSDQPSLCCLTFLRRHCKADGMENQTSCQPLFWHQILVLYSLSLTAVIIPFNVYALVFKALGHDADAVLMSHLAVTNILITTPLATFTYWHWIHGTRIAFFEPFLASNIWCSISGDILTGLTQLSTLFSLLIALVRYYGIVRNRRILSDYKLHFYCIITSAWSCFILISISLTYSDTENPARFVDCLFGHIQSARRRMLLAYSAIQMAMTIVTVLLYTNILKVIVQTRRDRTIGQKHGRDTFISSVIKVIAINVCCIIPCLFQAVFLAWISLTTDVSSESLVSSIVLFFPLQSIFNPLMHSLCIRCFVAAISRLKTIVINTL